MKFGNVNAFDRGWIVGNFEPSLCNAQDSDIGILRIKKGNISDGHHHKKHVEYNIIISGKVRVKNKILVDDDIFIYEPLDESHVQFLEDTVLLVIKNPSTKNDKYYNKI